MKACLFPLLIFSILFNFHKIPAQDLSYPDAALPDSVARVFAPGIVSLDGFYEEGICFSNNGEELYFTRKDLRPETKDKSDIYCSSCTNGVWTKPVRASFNSGAYDAEPAISGTDGKIYFFSERRKPGISSFIGEIWTTGRKAHGWQKPVYLENTLNETWVNHLSAAAKDVIYFTSFREKQIGIFTSKILKGDISPPLFLPPEINSIAGASNPFISPDESILLFEGKSGGYDYSEIYISFRTTEGLWQPAIKLNDRVNLTRTESNPSLSPDGKYLFFTRNGDIYWIKLDYVF